MVSRNEFARRIEEIEQIMAQKTDVSEIKISNEFKYIIEIKEFSENQHDRPASQQDASNAGDGTSGGQDGRAQVTEQEIFDGCYNLCMRILRERPLKGLYIDSRHILRSSTITLLKLLLLQVPPFDPGRTQNRAKELILTIFDVIGTDSEEIAIDCFEIIEFLVDKKIELVEIEERVVAYAKNYIEFLSTVPQLLLEGGPDLLERVQAEPGHVTLEQARAMPEMSVQHDNFEHMDRDTSKDMYISGTLVSYSPNSAKTFKVFGGKSLLHGSDFIRRLFEKPWRTRSTDQQQQSMRVINSVKGEVFQLLEQLSSKTRMPKTSQQLMYYLANIVELMTNITYLIKSDREYLVNNVRTFVMAFVTVARSIPANCCDLRRKHFLMFNNFVFYSNKLQLLSNPALLDQIAQNMDALIDERVLHSTGPITKIIIDVQVKYVLAFIFEHLQSRIKPGQMASVVQIMLHWMLNPVTSFTLKNFIATEFYHIQKKFWERSVSDEVIYTSPDGSVSVTNVDLQLEILYTMIKAIKHLRFQTEEGVRFFKKYPDGVVPQPELTRKTYHELPEQKGSLFEKQYYDPSTNKVLQMDNAFQLKENELVHANNQSFENAWTNICESHEAAAQQQQQQQGITQSAAVKLQERKEQFLRNTKTFFLYIEKVLILIQQLSGKVLDDRTMKLMKRFVKHGFYLIYNLYELIPVELIKYKEICEIMRLILCRLKVSQFRDLLKVVGNEIFGLIIETKARGFEGGLMSITKNLMEFKPIETTSNTGLLSEQSVGDRQKFMDAIIEQRSETDFQGQFLELFFYYIKEKIELFDGKTDDNKEQLLNVGLSFQEQRLMKIPIHQVQKALQTFLLTIGEQTLRLCGDIRVKHTFFGVFVFFIQKIRSGFIVPQYFKILRTLLKEIMNSEELAQSDGQIKEVMRDYTNIFKGLLETFLQAKQEATYVKESNEICCLVPAKPKHLLDCLPAISMPLIHSMSSNQQEQIESGIQLIQYWLAVLAPYPDLLNPVLKTVMPELNKALINNITIFPSPSFKLMGKLGAKTRRYNYYNKNKPRNYSEDGLKICLKDKNSDNTITFGIDGFIDVILIRHMGYPDSYTPCQLMQAIDFVKCAFLSYIDPNLNVDFILAAIVASKTSNTTPGPAFFDLHGIKAPQLAFNATEKQIFVKQMTRGSESHIFEKILRCLIFGCYSLPSTTPEHKKVQRKHTQFMKWVTKYFTLIYICKNGQLQSTIVDEINPILFIDYIDQFLFYNIQTSIYSVADRPYYKGSVIAIKTMLRMLKALYGDKPEIFDNLEIIPLLIKKICQQVNELSKTLAVNIAIQILLQELPVSTIKKHGMIILNTLFLIVNTSTGSVIKNIEKELMPTFDQFLQAIGCYDVLLQNGGFEGIKRAGNDLNNSAKDDLKLFNQVVDKILKNLLSIQKVSRSMALVFLEKIAASNKTKVHHLLQNILYIETSIVPRTSTQQAQTPVYWAEHIQTLQIEQRVHEIIKLYKGGYTQVQTLMAYIDLVSFVLKYGDERTVIDRKHIFLLIADYIVLVLEDESDLFDRCNGVSKLNPGPNVTLTKLTKQYVKMERTYLFQNKDYDPYSATMHSHQLLNKHYFEINMTHKEEKVRIEIAELTSKHEQQSSRIFKLPVTNNTNPDELNKEAEKDLTVWDKRNQIQTNLLQKIENYIQKLLVFQHEEKGSNRPVQPVQRQHEISFDYMHNVYEMYPNVRLHCEFIVECLSLLCEIVAHPNLRQDFRLRQREFFNNLPTQEDHTTKFDQSCLKTQFDYFMVEIKAKIICIVFKFFQRDEEIIQKQTKKCLKSLLSIEHSPNEALPHNILKEVIRPHLIQFNVSRSNEQNYQHLSKLIKILYSCFNDALTSLMTSTLRQLQDLVMEDYSSITPQHFESKENEGDQAPRQQQLQPQQQEAELNFLIEQHNDKILKISMATNIINVLPLLIYQIQTKPGRELEDFRREYAEIIQKILHFQHFLIYDFERKFEEKMRHILLLDPNARLRTIQELYNSCQNRLSPLQADIGHLRSEIKKGLSKLFNMQQEAAQECLKEPKNVNLFFDILSSPQSYCLRERLSREREINQQDRLFNVGNNRSIDHIKQNNNNEFTPKFVQFVNQTYIFSKFYPQYLLQKRNIKILDNLRFAWLKNTSSNSLLITQAREIYMKIQKCLVIYCRNEHSDQQILFDLLKEFFSPLSLDMSPLVNLCTVEIPNKASVDRKLNILNTTLEKIQTSQSSHEQKYTMFEFAFMPIILQCANNARKFHELFSKKMIAKFIETFFYIRQRPQSFPNTEAQLIWRNIRLDLEHGYKIASQNFLVELVKVLIIFFKYVPSYKYLLDCIPEQNETNIVSFLDWAGRSQDYTLKEFALYAMSCIGLRKMHLEVSDSPDTEGRRTQSFDLRGASFDLTGNTSSIMEIRRVENGVVVPLSQSQSHYMKKQFLDLLAQNVLAPILEMEHSKIKNLSVVENTFVNLYRVFSDSRTTHIAVDGNNLRPEDLRILKLSDNGFWDFYKRRFSLKPQFSARLKLCSFVCKKEAICKTGEIKLDRRLNKIVQFFTQNASTLNLAQFKEPLEIVESLLVQAQNLLKNLPNELMPSINHELAQIYSSILHIFNVKVNLLDWKMLKSMQQSGSKNDFLQFSEHCMQILRRIFHICRRPLGFFMDYSIPELPKEIYLLKTIMAMNNYAIAVMQVEQFPFNQRIMVDYLRESYLSHHEIKMMDKYISQGVTFEQAQSFAQNQSRNLQVSRQMQRQGSYTYQQLLEQQAQNARNPGATPICQFSSNQNQLVIVQFPVHLITLTLTKKAMLFKPQQMEEFYFVLYQAMRADVRQASKRDLKQVQDTLVRYYIHQQTDRVKQMSEIRPGVTPPSNTPQVIHQQLVDDQKTIQLCIPSFSIRMIYKLEQLRDQGVLTMNEFNTVVDKFLYKEITHILFKVISAFRHSISSEKQSLKPQQATEKKAKEESKGTESEEAESDSNVQDSDEEFDLNQDVEFGTKAKVVDGKTETYIDYSFPENQIEFKTAVDYSLDIWTKESVMIALKSIVIHMKTALHQDEAFQLLEQVKVIMKWFQMFKTCEYILEQLYEVTKLLIIDSPEEKIKLAANEKINWLYKLLNTAKLKELADARQVKASLVNKVFELCLDFLEQQHSINQKEGFIAILDKLMRLKPCCSFELRQRIYRVFEKFHGSSLRAKLIYFFTKITQDDHEKVIQQCQINNLLDFTLYNFQENISLHKVKDSSSLYRMSNQSIVVKGMDVFNQSAEGKAIKNTLMSFTSKFEKYKNKQLKDLMKPLSEIIRINPEHSLDTNIAEKIFSKVFWQFWHFMERSDQQYLAEAFNKIFVNFIKLTSTLTPQIKSQFCKTLLEQVVALKEPQVRIEPEVLQYLGKHFNLWHVCIPQLEDHVMLFPNNERYVHSLQELYERLMEEDMSAGLHRVVTKSPEMRTLITLGQHERWDQINQQFGQYINFYSEQEGFFSLLEGQQRTAGKYSRQISKTAICDMLNPDERRQRPANMAPREPAFVKKLEDQDADKLAKSSCFPKAGSNRKISDIDLRMWEGLFVKSLRILKRFDLYKDILENMYNREMKIDYLWCVKDLPKLEEELNHVLAQSPKQIQGSIAANRNKKDTISENSIARVKYHLYQNFILGNPGHQEKFDLNFRETIKLAIKQLCENLPLYLDRVHNEYHILFQLINESIEGGRNILMSTEIKRFSDFRQAFNIWRERLPHDCETILVWQELLENRNFVFRRLADNIKEQTKNQGVTEQLTRGQEEDQIDIVWNNLKLAEISRKQELPQLANYYLQSVKDVLVDPSTKGDVLKLERFKMLYETFKLVTKYQTDSNKIKEVNLAALEFFQNKDFDLWMHAEILRLEGEFALSKGMLNSAKEKLLQSINKNRKEAKTWISYGRLNELVFKESVELPQSEDIDAEVKRAKDIKDERSACNAFKGYFCGLTLNQSKSRFIMPHIFNLCKLQHPQIQENQNLRKFIYGNVIQMPAWIWIFWMPQLLHFLKQARHSQQQTMAHRIFSEKLIKMYPQATYYTLMEKRRQINYMRRNNPPNTPPSPQEQLWIELLEKNSRTLKAKGTKQIEGINEMIQELFQLSKVSSDDSFLRYLCAALEKSQQIPNSMPIEAELNKHLSQLYEKFLKKNHVTDQTQLKPNNYSENACCQIIAPEFYKHFIIKDTQEKSFLEQMKLIKNFKDFMLIQKQLKDQQPQLQELSQNLANFHTKGIELPCQYVINFDEPRPESVKMIEKIKPVINRTGHNEKKIEFKCNDGKSYAFALIPFNNNIKATEQFDKFLSEERATQLKVVTNMLFDKHKESKRRGLKLYAAPRILVQGVRLVKDNLQFADLQSTHDYLLLERGLDPDMALLMHIEQVKDILATLPEDKRVLASIDSDHVEEINLASYKQMVKEVEPFLLSSYFHRIFYNVDNMFIFRKQFTKFHAVNSFFSYVFNQSKNTSLSQLSFCKASGKINFIDTELRLAQCPKTMQVNVDFDEIEDMLFQYKKTQSGPQLADLISMCYMPFRLTPNIEEFIGQIGLNGLFAGVMTAASMAISAQHQNYAALLHLLFSDEFSKEGVPGPDESVQRTTDFCIYKVRSLINHERILDQPEKEEALKSHPSDPIRRECARDESAVAETTSQDDETFMIGQYRVPSEYFDLQMERPWIPEEFNKKVFTLIEMARDDQRRALRHLNWCPWF